METLAATRRVVSRVSRALTLLGAYALLASAILICIDIVLRRFFAMSVAGSDELSGYALAIGTAWAFGFAFLTRSHIRIDILRQYGSGRTRACMDVFAALVLFLAAALLCYYGGRELAESIRYSTVANTPLRVPLWMPQSLWVSGLLLFAISTGVVAVEALLRLIAGDHEGVATIAGIPSDGRET